MEGRHEDPLELVDSDGKMWDEWEELLEYGSEADPDDYQNKLREFIAKCVDPYDPIKMQLADCLCNVQLDSIFMPVHLKLGILAAIEVKNIKFLELYMDFLRRELELIEIKTGIRFEKDCTAEDLSELEDKEIDIYNELKLLYDKAEQFLDSL